MTAPAIGLFGIAPAVVRDRIAILDVQRQVARRFNLRMVDMRSACRGRSVARPRQVAMYLSRRFTARSLPEIGRMFGNRDHTTVMHAIATVEKLRHEDAKLDEEIAWVEAALVRDPRHEAFGA